MLSETRGVEKGVECIGVKSTAHLTIDVSGDVEYPSQNKVKYVVVLENCGPESSMSRSGDN